MTHRSCRSVMTVVAHALLVLVAANVAEGSVAHGATTQGSRGFAADARDYFDAGRDLAMAAGGDFGGSNPEPDREAVHPGAIDLVRVQDAYFKASNTGGDDAFGSAVAVSGDTAVIGAPAEDSSATGVDGDGANNSADSSGAVYVFQRANGVWSQQAYLKPSNTGAGDRFGHSVAVSGDTIVVGAPQEDSDATGVNADQANNAAPDSGAAYVFTRVGGEWVQQAYLKPSNTGSGDGFGYSVAITDDTIVVGSWREGSAAIGINGDQDSNAAVDAGAAYVFVRQAGSWSQQAYLKASNTGPSDFFGYSVAASGDTVLIGARWEDSNAAGVGGDETDNSASDAGAAYVFVRAGSAWSQQAYLKAAAPGAGDEFGFAVGLSGDTAVVGARWEDSGATGVDGDPDSTVAFDAGAAYVFGRAGQSWTQQAYLKASNTNAGDFFGYSVAVADGTVVVGAPAEASSATGVNGDESSNAAFDAGAGYLFRRNQGSWSQQAYLKASNTGGGDRFGISAATSGDAALLGAPRESSNATGVNGNENDESASRAGAAYRFEPARFTIGGSVSGLLGSGLVLQNNKGDDLAVAANGSFAFATALSDGSGYSVQVAAQPVDPSQTCSIDNSAGTLAGADVDDVLVACDIDTWVVAAAAIGEGSIGPATQKVEDGANASFSVSPQNNHHVVSVTGDTCTPLDQGAGNWRAFDISEDCAVIAMFERDFADLQIAKQSNLDSASDGDTVVYAITVANAGPYPVSGARLEDLLSPALADVSWACLPEVSNTDCPPPPFDAGSGSLQSDIDLPVGGFLRYDVFATVESAGAGVVSNRATIEPPAGVDELDPSNNSAIDTIPILPWGIFGDGFEEGGAPIGVPKAAEAQRHATAS